MGLSRRGRTTNETLYPLYFDDTDVCGVLYVGAVLMDFFAFDFVQAHNFLAMWGLFGIGVFLNWLIFYDHDVLGVKKKR